MLDSAVAVYLRFRLLLSLLVVPLVSTFDAEALLLPSR